MPAESKARLKNVFASLDPLRLLDEIRAAQGVLSISPADARLPAWREIGMLNLIVF